jgi:ketosteroid isomerase-like protein
MFALALRAFAQHGPGANGSSDPKAKAEVEQALRDFYKAFFQGDKEAVNAFFIDDGFSYQPGVKLQSGKSSKEQMNYNMDLAKNNGPYAYELSEITILMIGNDVAIANYRGDARSLKDQNDQEHFQITDTLVRRNGRWQILAEHASPIDPPAERVIAGLPTGWTRSTVPSANNYVITVDTSTKHDGNASASIKFGCGNDLSSWTSLLQAIAADDYRGKRVRLSGWLRTADVTEVGLWMRVDDDLRMLAFDNMQDRPIKGTTDWQMYSVVLDVPIEATKILFGTNLVGRGQVWSDDFKLEIVDDSVASTNITKLVEALAEQPAPSKSTKELNRHPVNTGFENGVVH